MEVDSRMLLLAAVFLASLPVCEGCRHSDSPSQPSQQASGFEIRWKGEDTGYRGTTVIHEDGTSRHD
jgi:hypothetical protein